MVHYLPIDQDLHLSNLLPYNPQEKNTKELGKYISLSEEKRETNWGETPLLTM